MFEQAEMFRADLKQPLRKSDSVQTEHTHTHTLGALILVCVCVCRNYDTRDLFFFFNFISQ